MTPPLLPPAKRQCLTACSHQQSSPPSPGAPSGSMTQTHEPDRMAERGLAALPDDVLHHHILPRLTPRDWMSCRLTNWNLCRLASSLLINPVSLKRHQRLSCDSPAFSRDKFTSALAPWLDRFNAGQTAALTPWLDHEAFPWLVSGALGTQLCKAPALYLEEREVSVQREGVQVREESGQYELHAFSTLTVSDTDRRGVDKGAVVQLPAGARLQEISLAPNRQRLLKVQMSSALVACELQQDGSWHDTAELLYEGSFYSAHWSPCSQLLATVSSLATKVWAGREDHLWEAVITGRHSCCLTHLAFSPDSRTVVYINADLSTHCWWCNQDGSWVPVPFHWQPKVFVRFLAFSADSRKLALVSATSIQICCFSPEDGWQQKGIVLLNTEGRQTRVLADGQDLPRTPGFPCSCQRVAFNRYGQMAVAYRLGRPWQPTQKRTVRRTCFEIWNFSSFPGKKQAKIVDETGCCERHSSDKYPRCGGGGVDKLFFSEDGRFLIT
ncbi:MAG: F-box/WD40 repeat-containing protein, partial [Kistimonas sp.]|nr:F-box/WD40 repeat-containing protein [Kistimonas sp.]